MNKLLLGFLFCIVSCHTSKVVVSSETNINASIDATEEATANDIAVEHYKDRYALDENFDGSFTIIKSKYKNIRDLLPDVYFIVYDNKSNVIVHSDTLKAGYVGWEGDYLVKAIERNAPENTESSSNQRTYYFDVNDREYLDEP